MKHQPGIAKRTDGEIVKRRDQNPTFAIHQIYYDARLQRFLDPAFLPYENIENERPEWREFHVFRKEWLAGTMDGHTYTGFFSWKFREKARIEGRALLDFAKDNPGADCYFINPFPDEIVRYPNMWLQGERCHPGLIETTEKIFRNVGYNRRLASEVHTSDLACYCNFWFGTSEFWNAYMNFCLPIYDYIEDRATDEEKSILWARADKKSDATMVPFIFERLFTEFLLNQRDFDVRVFRYSPEHLRRRFHKRFVEIYRGADALKRAQTRNPDEDLLLGMTELSHAASLMSKAIMKKKMRRRAKNAVRGAWNSLRRNPPGVLEP